MWVKTAGARVERGPGVKSVLMPAHGFNMTDADATHLTHMRESCEMRKNNSDPANAHNHGS